MKNRGTYVLLVLFFAGLVGLWVADFAHVPTRREQERMSTRILYELIDTKHDQLRKIEILGGEAPLVFERQKTGTGWQMTSPMNVAADPSKVETLAFNLKELSRKPEAATLEGDPAHFGLAPPERIIRLWGPSTDSPLASLELGKVSLDRRYVRHVGSEGAEVVEARGLDLVKLAPINWRDHELFRVPSLEVNAVNIVAGGKELKLRRGRDSWRITAPFHTLAAEARVEGLIADLGTLKVLDDSRFVANDVTDLERYGLKTPAMTIEVFDAGRTNNRRELQVLHIGKPVEGKEGLVYARRGDEDDVVAIETRVLKDLRPEPNLYRSPKVADVNPARVIRIGVEDASGVEFEVVRSPRGWTIVETGPSLADQKAIDDFLKSLDQLQTSNYPSPEAVPDTGLAKPSLVLRIWQARDRREPASSESTSPKGDLTMELRIGRRDAGRKSIYAQLAGDPTVLALPDTANDFLPRSSLAFRDRQILAEVTDQIERINILIESRKVTLNSPALKLDPLLGSGPIGWWMVEPVNAPANPESVGKLLKLLANLRADSLVAEKSEDLAKFGLKSPALTLTWSKLPPFSLLRSKSVANSSPGTITLEDHRLLVGAPVPGRVNVRYAKLSDRPLIFTLGPDILGVLDSEWRDHHVLSFNAKRARKVQLDWPDRQLTLDANGSGTGRKWSLAASTDGLIFDPERIETLLQASSDLTTTRFAQYLGDFPVGWRLTPPLLTIRIELDDGSPARTLKLGALTGQGQVLASTENEPRGAIFLVPESLFGSWLRPPRRHDDLPESVFAP